MAAAVTTILNLVESRLELITTTNEYNYTVKKIKRGMLKPWISGDLPAINYWSTGLTNEKNAYGDDDRTIPLFIEMHTKTHDESYLDIASKLAADIVTALNRATTAPKVSDNPSYDLGGVISDLAFNGYDHEIGEGQSPWCGVLVSFDIKYNTSIFDMTTYSV